MGKQRRIFCNSPEEGHGLRLDGDSEQLGLICCSCPAKLPPTQCFPGWEVSRSGSSRGDMHMYCHRTAKSMVITFSMT